MGVRYSRERHRRETWERDIRMKHGRLSAVSRPVCSPSLYRLYRNTATLFVIAV